MPIPQVNDRIKEVPVVVLRAVFAGIGQILLTADKVRARAAEQVWAPEKATAPGVETAAPRSAARATVAHTSLQAGSVTHPPPVAGQGAKARPVAKTTKSGPAPRSTKAPGAAKATPSAKATTATPARKTTKTTPPAKAPKTTPPAKAPKAAPAPKVTPSSKDAAPPGRPGAAVAAPPLPGYDDLSVASLRARLRVLDATTVGAMLAYEKAHARREPVIAMLERRLAKLSAG